MSTTNLKLLPHEERTAGQEEYLYLGSSLDVIGGLNLQRDCETKGEIECRLFLDVVVRQ